MGHLACRRIVRIDDDPGMRMSVRRGHAVPVPELVTRRIRCRRNHGNGTGTIIRVLVDHGVAVDRRSEQRLEHVVVKTSHHENLTQVDDWKQEKWSRSVMIFRLKVYKFVFKFKKNNNVLQIISMLGTRL